MKITTQSGEVVNSHEITFTGKKITCTPDYSINVEVVCGVYKDSARTIEVYSEMACIGWSNKYPEYVMPAE